MTTICEYLTAERTALTAERTAEAADQALLNSEISATEMNLFLVNMNLMLNGCTTGGAPMATEPEGVAETRGRERLIEAIQAKMAEDIAENKATAMDARQKATAARKLADEIKAALAAEKSS